MPKISAHWPTVHLWVKEAPNFFFQSNHIMFGNLMMPSRNYFRTASIGQLMWKKPQLMYSPYAVQMMIMLRGHIYLRVKSLRRFTNTESCCRQKVPAALILWAISICCVEFFSCNPTFYRNNSTIKCIVKEIAYWGN